jgi:hypothetical protein
VTSGSANQLIALYDRMLLEYLHEGVSQQAQIFLKQIATDKKGTPAFLPFLIL